MKSLIKKVLFKKQPEKIFPAVQIQTGEIQEKAFLKSRTGKMDVSNRHNIVCQTPFCIAVWIDTQHLSLFDSDNLKLIIEKNNRLVASLNILRLFKLKESNETIFIFKITKVRCRQLTLFSQYLLLSRFFKSEKHSYLESEIYGAIYSYPKKIIIVSYKDNEYYNIFPMDFQGYYPEENLYLLGLRTTNITVKKIIETKCVVISDIDAIDIKTIYALGAHHSKTPRKIEELPFKVKESELFKFPLPEFASSYNEVEIIGNYELGTHMMIVGKIKNSKKIKENLSSLYHLHFFEYVNSNYQEVN
jgi:flavin reductase (DIM6/NTAB) family NADH-FMN oxidoreductase RutF